jgi:hypothetical protein
MLAALVTVRVAGCARGWVYVRMSHDAHYAVVLRLGSGLVT